MAFYANSDGVRRSLELVSEFGLGGHTGIRDHIPLNPYTIEKRSQPPDFTEDYYNELTLFASAKRYNDDDDDGDYNQVYDLDSSDSESSVVQRDLPQMDSSTYTPAYGCGRGKMLQNMGNVIQKRNERRIHSQFKKDKEIKEQLQVVGALASNEEIEEVFTSTFKKIPEVRPSTSPKPPESVEVKEKDLINNITFSTSSSCVGSAGSSLRGSSPKDDPYKLNMDTKTLKEVLQAIEASKQKRDQKRIQRVYVPPHRRKNEESVVQQSGNSADNQKQITEKKNVESNLAVNVSSKSTNEIISTRKSRNCIVNQFSKPKSESIRSTVSDKVDQCNRGAIKKSTVQNNWVTLPQPEKEEPVVVEPRKKEPLVVEPKQEKDLVQKSDEYIYDGPSSSLAWTLLYPEAASEQSRLSELYSSRESPPKQTREPIDINEILDILKPDFHELNGGAKKQEDSATFDAEDLDKKKGGFEVCEAGSAWDGYEPFAKGASPVYGKPGSPKFSEQSKGASVYQRATRSPVGTVKSESLGVGARWSNESGDSSSETLKKNTTSLSPMEYMIATQQRYGGYVDLLKPAKKKDVTLADFIMAPKKDKKDKKGGHKTVV